MASGLQEQRVGDDGADRGKRQRTGDHVLRAMQQYPHREAALGFRFDRNRTGATAAARHVVIPGNLFRHFSSPDELDLGLGSATPA
jgi:hypothetical protein